MYIKINFSLRTIFPLGLAVLFLLTFPAKGQVKPAPSPSATPERPREIVALLNDARLAAPELAVDTFLKVLETRKVTDPVWRKEILEEALRTIDDVQYPMPMRPAYGGKVERNNELLDTLDIVLAGALKAKLDRLSFKGRVITLLLQTDKERAKQMIFQMGGQLGLRPRTCEDALTYAPEGIYVVVGEVAKAVFTPRQVAEGQRALFVAPWIENIESPRQIYPALELAQQMQGSPVEKQIIADAVARAIDRDLKDDRSFTYAWDGITTRVKKLAEDEPDTLKGQVLNAYRGMLLKNLQGVRCSDNAIKKGDPLPDYVETANDLMPERPLTPEEVTTREVGGTAKLTHILKKSSVSLKFRDEGIAVRDTRIVDNKIVNHDVNDVEWVARVNEYIDRMLAFDGTENETEGEMLFIKGALLGGMLSGVGPGDLRRSIVRKYLRLLANSPLQKTSFIEWRGWLRDAERMAPESFYDVAAEFPNPNLKVLIEVNKLLGVPKNQVPNVRTTAPPTKP